LAETVIWIILAVVGLPRWLIAKQNMRSHMRCFLSTISEKQKYIEKYTCMKAE